MSAAVPPAFSEDSLRRDIAYLERALTSLAAQDAPAAAEARENMAVQLRRRRKQLRALLAGDFDNWPRYPDDPLDATP